MGTFLKALLEKTGIRWFFSGLPVELPAYFLPNFRVVEINAAKVSHATVPLFPAARLSDKLSQRAAHKR